MGQLEGIVDRFEGRRLLVVGDVILDRFIWGHVKRISPEAPVPVVEVERISDHLGGAANVAVNLARLGARVSLLGVVGSDAAGRKVVRKLGELGIEASGVVLDESRATTLKSRVIAQHQQVCRTDRENREPLNEGPLDRLLESLADSVKLAEGVILSDYAKGVVGSELTREVIERARASGKFVSVDPKGTDFAKYRGATVITPNQAEFEAAAEGDLPADRADWPAAADSLMERTAVEALLVTRGEMGMSLYQGEDSHSIRASAREVFDVTGAGDTVISVFSLSVVSGGSFHEAAVLANLAAGIVVAKLGTASASKTELLEALSVSPDYAKTVVRC